MKIVRDGYINVIGLERLDLTKKSEEETLNLYLDKIKEEVLEIIDSQCLDPEEYADAIEAILGLAHQYGLGEEVIQSVRKKKLLTHGGFRTVLVLKDVPSEIKEYKRATGKTRKIRKDKGTKK